MRHAFARLAIRVDPLVPSVGRLLVLIWLLTVIVDVSALVPLAIDPRSSLLLAFPIYLRIDVYPDVPALLLAAGCTLIAVATSLASRLHYRGRDRSARRPLVPH